MEFFQKIIHFLAYGVIIFSVVEVYLTLNKLWSRKHIKEVADSISISARATGMIPGMVFTINYFFEQQWQGVIDGVIWFGAAIVQILIAAGLWVAGNQKRNVFSLITRSIKDESQEIDNLAKSIFQVGSREKIVDLLAATALTDKVLKDKEKEYIENLASSWGIEVDWEGLMNRIRKKDVSATFNMSFEIQNYMKLNPSKKEFKLLLSCIRRLSDQSGLSRVANQHIIDEFAEAYSFYGSKSPVDGFKVQVVPQEKEQHERINASGVQMTSEYIGSGFTYVFGPMFTQRFADKVATEFEDLGYFSAVKNFRLEPEKATG